MVPINWPGISHLRRMRFDSRHVLSPVRCLLLICVPLFSIAGLWPQTCVLGNTLWLFGGTIEVGDKEITLDDIWSLDLQV